MRIGLIITELHPGGAEKCFVQLAIYLKSLGHEVQVWQLWPEPPLGKRQLTDQLDQHQITWKSGGAVRPWHFLSTARWLSHELQTFKPDIVQSFLFHGNLAAAIASRRSPWKLFGGARVRQPERYRQLLQRWSSKAMHRLICVSQGVLEHCRDREGIPSEKLAVIANGISLKESPTPIDIANFGVPADRPILLFVGRLDPQKGVDGLLQNADSILERLPDHQLVFVGEGPLQKQLLSQKSELIHAARVHFVGWHPAPLAWMHRCETLLLPARYEGMPNVVLEAMSVGKPVVVFDVEGVRELLGEPLGEVQTANPQVVAVGNFSKFVAAVIGLAEDDLLREKCGRDNRERIKRNFELEQQLGKYLAFYTTKTQGPGNTDSAT